MNVLQMLKDELQGWLNLSLGVSMFFFAALIGEIGRIGDWMFKGKNED